MRNADTFTDPTNILSLAPAVNQPSPLRILWGGVMTLQFPHLYRSVAEIHDHGDVRSKPDVYKWKAWLLSGNPYFWIATLFEHAQCRKKFVNSFIRKFFPFFFLSLYPPVIFLYFFVSFFFVQ